MAKRLGQTESPGLGMATCQVPLTTRLGQLPQAFLLPQVVLCPWEVFCPLYSQFWGPPGMASWYWLCYVIHCPAAGAHGQAGTFAAALPGEFSPQHGPSTATCVLQAIYESRKPTDLPFQASNFIGWGVSPPPMKDFPETLH